MLLFLANTTAVYGALARKPAPRKRSSSAQRTAPLWEYADEQWDYKVRPVKAGTQSGGRSRAASREAFYETLRTYSDRFGPLLQSEFEAEQEELRVMLQSWPTERLVREGWLLKRLSAKQLPDFYSSPRLQLSLQSAPDSARRPLPFHRFSAGDMVALAHGDTPMLPAEVAEASGLPKDDASGAARAGVEVVEGVVLERTATALQIVVRSLPAGVQSRRAGGGSRGGAGSGGSGTIDARQNRWESEDLRGPASGQAFCLTRHVSGVPHERCQKALSVMSDPAEADAICSELRAIVTATPLPITPLTAAPASPLAPQGKPSRAKGAVDEPRKAFAAGERAALAPSFLAAHGNPQVAVKAAVRALTGAGEARQATRAVRLVGG